MKLYEKHSRTFAFDREDRKEGRKEDVEKFHFKRNFLLKLN